MQLLRNFGFLFTNTIFIGLRIKLYKVQFSADIKAGKTYLFMRKRLEFDTFKLLATLSDDDNTMTHYFVRYFSPLNTELRKERWLSYFKEIVHIILSFPDHGRSHLENCILYSRIKNAFRIGFSFLLCIH